MKDESCKNTCSFCFMDANMLEVIVKVLEWSFGVSGILLMLYDAVCFCMQIDFPNYRRMTAIVVLLLGWAALVIFA